MAKYLTKNEVNPGGSYLKAKKKKINFGRKLNVNGRD